MTDPIYTNMKIAEIYQPITRSNLLNETIKTGDKWKSFKNESQALEHAEKIAQSDQQDSVVVFDETSKRYEVYPIDELSKKDSSANQTPGFYRIEATANANFSFVVGEAEDLQYIQPHSNGNERKELDNWLQTQGYTLDKPLPKVIQVLAERLTLTQLNELSQNQPETLSFLKNLNNDRVSAEVFIQALSYNGKQLSNALQLSRYIHELESTNQEFDTKAFELIFQQDDDITNPEKKISDLRAMGLSLEAKSNGILCELDDKGRMAIFHHLKPTTPLNLDSIIKANNLKPLITQFNQLTPVSKALTQHILNEVNPGNLSEILAAMTYLETLVEKGISLPYNDLNILVTQQAKKNNPQDVLAALGTYGILSEGLNLKTEFSSKKYFADLQSKLIEGKLIVQHDASHVANNAEASYSPFDNSIQLRQLDYTVLEQRATVLHELTHALQDIDPKYHFKDGTEILTTANAETQAFLVEGLLLIENSTPEELKKLKESHEFREVQLMLAEFYIEYKEDKPLARQKLNIVAKGFKEILSGSSAYGPKINNPTFNDGI